MKAKRLIINADDFGLSLGVNKGIIESIENGVVSSISVIANFRHMSHVLEITKSFPNISIGIHYNLTTGKPITNPSFIPSLVRANGDFWGKGFSRKLLRGRIRFSDIKTELEKQTKVLADLVPHISHFDGHQANHLYPLFFSAALKVAHKFGIRKVRCPKRYIARENHVSLLQLRQLNIKRWFKGIARRTMMIYLKAKGFKTADRFVSLVFNNHSMDSLRKSWLSMVRNLPPGSSEICCHPGFADEILLQHSKYTYKRETEIAVLTSRELKQAFEENDVKIISYNEL